MVRNFFFSYIGGKFKDLKYIQPFVNLEGINRICEPFCGSCSLSLHQKNNELRYLLNDIDVDLFSFLSEIKKGNFANLVDFFNKERPQYEKDGKPTKEWYIMKAKKDKTPQEWFLFRRATRGGSLLDLRLQHVKREDYRHLEEFFGGENVELTNNDYLKVFERVKNHKHTFVFLDPPYLDSFNASYESFHGGSIDTKKVIQDRTKMFIDILEFIKEAKCKVMLIINKNSITEYLFKGYIKFEYAKRYDMTGRCTFHIIVTNY